jgi:hypothetical protein
MTAPKPYGRGLDPARLAAVSQQLAGLLPGLDEAGATAVVRQVAWNPRPLRELGAHLAARPQALFTGDLDQAPPSAVRLAKALAGQGFSDVRVPACLRCGRTDRELPGRVPGGRICQPCAHRATATACSVCGKVRPVQGRAADGGALCDGCLPRPRRVCGQCGNLRRVVRRATATTPQLCGECACNEIGVCTICGKTKRCRRYRDGRRVCSVCQSAALAPKQPCCRCGRVRPVLVRWPAGPICAACYGSALNNPRSCPACGRRAVLTGTGPDGQPICAPCAGSGRTYDCPHCGQPCHPLRGGRCAHVALDERVHELLNVKEHPELASLLTALTSTDNPRTVLTWLRGEAGTMLASLAATGRPLTHAVLDDLPNTGPTRYLRALLVSTAVLPDRDEYIERVTARLTGILADAPTHHARIVRRYATWDVLPRARRLHTPGRRPSTSATSQHLRQKIHLALQFLAWLDQHGTDLHQLTQADLEAYLDEHVTTRPLEGFITWLRRHHQIGDVRMPRAARRAGPVPISDQDRWQHLRRCLTDEQLRLPVRVAGALLLLYGNPVTRSVALTADALTQDGDHYYLTLAQRPVLLPPALADLVIQLRDQARPGSRVGQSVTAPGWLFPGRHPGQHRNGPGFTTTLAAAGIDVRPARTAALMALAEQLPAAVLGPLLGLHPHTAAAWTALVKRDWTAYIAARTPTPAGGGQAPPQAPQQRASSSSKTVKANSSSITTTR